MFEGVIFDFNGTLFWDTHLHNLAWDQFLENHNISLSDDEKNNIIHGKNNQEIFTELFERKISTAEMNQLINQKESIYQQICRDGPMDLAPGAEDFLNYLSLSRIPFNLATASGKENVDFYFQYLDLGKWFKMDKAIYNDGKIPGKPRPDIFILAAKKIELPLKKIIIFEDSFNGIQAAERSGAGRIYIVNSTGDDYSQWTHEVIKSFDEVDRSIF